MKLIATTLLLLPASDSKKSDRKVPPRRPEQRLETLHRFLKTWLAENVGSESLESPREGRADDMLDSNLFGESLDWNTSAIMDTYTKAWSEDDSIPMCSYFDPENKPSGGPRRKTEPGHESRRSKMSQRRKRREIEEEADAEYEEMEELSDLLPEEDDALGARRMDQKLIDRIQNSENFFDIIEMAFEKRKNTNAIRALSADSDTAWKQLRTAYLKWIRRYLADCPTERRATQYELDANGDERRVMKVFAKETSNVQTMDSKSLTTDVPGWSMSWKVIRFFERFKMLRSCAQGNFNSDYPNSQIEIPKVRLNVMFDKNGSSKAVNRFVWSGDSMDIIPCSANL